VEGVINEEIPSNLIESVGEITSGLLHGEWIKVERQNRNKKVMLTVLMGMLGAEMVNIHKILSFSHNENKEGHNENIIEIKLKK